MRQGQRLLNKASSVMKPSMSEHVVSSGPCPTLYRQWHLNADVVAGLSGRDLLQAPRGCVLTTPQSVPAMLLIPWDCCPPGGLGQVDLDRMASRGYIGGNQSAEGGIAHGSPAPLLLPTNLQARTHKTAQWSAFRDPSSPSPAQCLTLLAYWY